jgi:hypothetical protein
LAILYKLKGLYKYLENSFLNNMKHTIVGYYLGRERGRERERGRQRDRETE